MTQYAPIPKWSLVYTPFERICLARTAQFKNNQISFDLWSKASTINLAVCFTVDGSLTKKISLSLLFFVRKLSWSEIELKRVSRNWEYSVQASRKCASSSTSPLLQIKQNLSSGGTLGLMNLAVSILRWRRPRRNFAKDFLCLKDKDNQH